MRRGVRIGLVLGVVSAVLGSVWVVADHASRPPAALLYSTFLGGADMDFAHAIEVDASGNAYVVGVTWSRDFPISSDAFDSERGKNTDAFVARFDSDGRLGWATYLGGDGYDSADTVAIDEARNVYVAGTTGSSDFPVTPDAFDATFNSEPYEDDVFLAKFDADGRLTYSTFLGGSGEDGSIHGNLGPTALAVDEVGSVYLVGGTDSPDFPWTSGAYSSNGGETDAFVVKFDVTGGSLDYAARIGGRGGDQADSVAVDSAGNAFVAGTAAYGEFPVTPGSFDTTFNGYDDAFLARVDSTGSRLTFCTFLGGGGDESVAGVALGPLGDAFVAGTTDSRDFLATATAYDPSLGGYSDAFVIRVAPQGDRILYSTLIGGSGREFAQSLRVDGAGRAHVVGSTWSSDFPASLGAFPTAHEGPSGVQDGFLATLDPWGSRLSYATFLGGNGEDWISAVSVDDAGGARLAGGTFSHGFPVTRSAFAPRLGGSADAFIAQLSLTPAPAPDNLLPTVVATAAGIAVAGAAWIFAGRRRRTDAARTATVAPLRPQ